jgi:phosphoadenosine phosphosulfate reductase
MGSPTTTSINHLRLNHHSSTIDLDLSETNQQLQNTNANQIVQWAVDQFGDGLVMTTSFGIQSAVMLHLVTQIVPNIPIVWVDTGYLPAKTYLFADELTQRLNLNLKVYQSLNRYDQIRKVEPMQRALEELKATAWLTGLRSSQTEHRKTLDFVSLQGAIYKVLPILNWSSKAVYDYLIAHDLPYHPLFDEGYVTVGDWHSSRPLMATDENERDTRFKGLKQECGIHLPQNMEESASFNSSSL